MRVNPTLKILICALLSAECLNVHQSTKNENFAVRLNGSSGLMLESEASDKFLTQFSRQTAFGVSVVVEPDGGQAVGASIVELTNICEDTSYWGIAITTDDSSDEERNLQFGVTVRGQWIAKAPISFQQVNRINVHFSTKQTSLSINNVVFDLVNKKIAFPLFTQSQLLCIRLFLGTRSINKQFVGFRGGISNLKFTSHYDDNFLFMDALKDLTNWKIIGSVSAIWDAFNRPMMAHYPKLTLINIPVCGKAICDDPNIIKHYHAENSPYRQLKTLKYTVIIVSESDGSNAIVSNFQIEAQHKEIETTLAQYNISLTLSVIHVARSNLRHKMIIFGCTSLNVGDGICQRECRKEATEDDGGDCQEIEFSDQCTPDLRGNGHCDHVCNSLRFDFDDGDCCPKDNNDTGDVHACIDPKNAYRKYMSADEYKDAIGIGRDVAGGSLVVYLVETLTDASGIATFPWEQSALTLQGGILLQANKFGVPGFLVHEIGHIFGLWHVHHGISEVPCDDECYEEAPSLVTGDLVEDTPPTIKSTQCNVADAPTESSCPRYPTTLANTNVAHNLMGYGMGGCADHFTPQQVARMHCFIDHTYSNWRAEQPTSSHVPLPPRVVPLDKHHVKLHWIPPINIQPCKPFIMEFPTITTSAFCTTDRRLVQYAAEASSEFAYKVHGFWTPQQATGPPDADLCSPSVRAWLPDTFTCHDPENPDRCVLILRPEFPTVVDEISLWVTWNAGNGIRWIKLVFADGFDLTVDSVFPQCDAPYTLPVYVRKPLIRVLIRTNNVFVAIDAIQFVSASDEGRCLYCQPTMYRVIRQPGFRYGQKVETTELEFVHEIDDFDVGNYTYSVEVINNAEVSQFFSLEFEENQRPLTASPLAYFFLNESGIAYCGDGILHEKEECDDGNLVSKDGCDGYCRVEPGFSCEKQSTSSRTICQVTQKESPQTERNLNMYSDISIHEFSTVIHPANFRAFLSPFNGPTNVSQLQMCSIPISPKKNVNNECTPKPDFFLNCPPQFFLVPFDKTGLILTLKAEFQPTFATHVILSVASLHPSLDSTVTISCTLLALLDNEELVTVSRHLETTCANSVLQIPLLKILTIPSDSRLLRIKAFVLQNVSSDSLIFDSVTLGVDPSKDLWSAQECEKKNEFYDPIYKMCMSSMNEPKCLDPPNLPEPFSVLHCRNASECRIQCNDVHESTGWVPVIRCVNNTWDWHPLTIRRSLDFCKPVECSQPVIPHATVSCPKGTAFQSSCSVRCDKYAVFIGQRSTIKCQFDGFWSPLDGVCMPVCSVNSAVSAKNVILSRNHCNRVIKINSDTLTKNASVVPIMTICKGACLPGYEVISGKKNRVRLSCASNDTWLGDGCRLPECPPFKPVYDGLYNCSNGFQVESKCTFSCPEGKEKITMCTQATTWSQRHPCAIAKTATCQVPTLGHGLELGCSFRLSVGQSCKVSCSPAGYEAVFMRLPSSLVKISAITCTASQKLSPQVDNLRCVRTCNWKTVGDGWCDLQNNRAHCHWDGGDCCASTSKTGMARHMFPTLCKSAFCGCLDPSAVENKKISTSGDSSLEASRRRSKRILWDNQKIKSTWIDKFFIWLDQVVSASGESPDFSKLADKIAIYDSSQPKATTSWIVDVDGWPTSDLWHQKKTMLDDAIARERKLLMYKI